ncbi:hypothetical protein HK099_001591 [Clydaea vesicula]|uniref:ABC transporter substrate-binding protein PnrA-like domain-containing protein n=1 Tax=Clydaea vesicula TaxID=447962 RepID=A0AAD5TTS6_9FUNG|nr:hypothetical protein HK099_001591 [Clydaea vesicula]
MDINYKTSYDISFLGFGVENILHIIIHSDSAAMAEFVPEAYKQLNFTLIDPTLPPTQYPNLATIYFAVGYLEGAVAGLMTETNNVAIIADYPKSVQRRYVNGFKQGVLAVCPICNIHHLYLKAFPSKNNDFITGD